MNLSDFFAQLYSRGVSGNGIERFFCSDDGKSSLYFSSPFRGVFCWVNDIFCMEIPMDVQGDFSGFSLNFCQEGACEVSLLNGNFVYVSKGVLSMDTSMVKSGHYYPSSRYRGLELVFDLSAIAADGGELARFGFDPFAFERLLYKEAASGSLMVMPSPAWQRKAAFLADKMASFSVSMAEIRFYVMELLFLLAHDSGNRKPLHLPSLTKGQRLLATEAERLLSADLSRHLTVEQLSAMLGVSPSSLKKYFSQCYGECISVYLHRKRMEHAARLLAQGSLSVGKIGEAVGYQNQGKFGMAFKEFFGETPLEYRRCHNSPDTRFSGQF